MYSNCCCRCSFEPEIIKIGQSSHKIYSNNIVNFQESTTILNACMNKSGNLLNTHRVGVYIYIYIYIYIIYIYEVSSIYIYIYNHQQQDMMIVRNPLSVDVSFHSLANTGVSMYRSP